MSIGTGSVPPQKPPHWRRLVLMFDGTGNKRLNLSNVARMFEAIDDSSPDDYVSYPMTGKDGPCGTCGLPVGLEPDRQPVQLVRYIKGVGTDFFGHLSGLGFGYGLSANVIEGYVWLSNNYHEGDEIFVFGFSRGAFSARSLVSLVHRCGGVLKNVSVKLQNKPELKESDPVVVSAYAMYQAYVQTTDRDGIDKNDRALDNEFSKKFHGFKQEKKSIGCDIHAVKVKMLGVWDTVGAVGIPETGYKLIDDHVYPMSRYSSKQYQFHGQGLSCIVENAYHALAIDEHRKHFAPTLWDKVTPENQEVKQVVRREPLQRGGRRRPGGSLQPGRPLAILLRVDAEARGEARPALLLDLRFARHAETGSPGETGSHAASLAAEAGGFLRPLPGRQVRHDFQAVRPGDRRDQRIKTPLVREGPNRAVGPQGRIARLPSQEPLRER